MNSKNNHKNLQVQFIVRDREIIEYLNNRIEEDKRRLEKSGVKAARFNFSDFYRDTFIAPLKEKIKKGEEVTS